MKPTLVNVMKVADIDSATISKELKEAIESYGPTYRDTVLDEDLFSVDEIGATTGIPDRLQEDLEALKEVCNQAEASYIRFVEP